MYFNSLNKSPTFPRKFSDSYNQNGKSLWEAIFTNRLLIHSEECGSCTHMCISCKTHTRGMPADPQVHGNVEEWHKDQKNIALRFAVCYASCFIHSI